MMKVTRAMMLTGAHGDAGYANKILFTRGFCYPRRNKF